MSEKWYYVENGKRVGPIEHEELINLITNKSLNGTDYVWKQGFENWTQIDKVDELNLPAVIEDEVPTFNLTTLDHNDKIVFLKIGKDRGVKEVEYGPFNLLTLKKLYKENRINGKTFVYTKFLSEWRMLAELDGFEEVFEEIPPAISDEDKRAFRRKPFIARMFFANNDQLFEGVCRDISIGGMQVLVDHFPAQVGERISLNVHPENSEHHFVADGEIVRKLEGDHGFSFRFIDLGSDAVQAIQNYVSKVE